MISIHAPARGATRLRRSPRSMRAFQFTPLREGRRTLLPGTGRRNNFNSRPCERGDKIQIQRKLWKDIISIHAPARGATGRTRFVGLGRYKISIHAPARGATGKNGRCKRNQHHFNSRPCERGDALPLYHIRPGNSNFNSRPCERGDMSKIFTVGFLLSFQFTPLREGRQQNQTKYALFFSAIIEKNS